MFESNPVLQVFIYYFILWNVETDSMTQTLCNEWGQFGIRVVGVAPGPIADTEGMRKLGECS